VDLAYLREHPHLLRTLLTHQRIRETPVDGGSICRASRLTLDSGESVFFKEWPKGEAPQGFFHAEASGLRWLAATGAIAVPEVIVEQGDMLGLEWVEHGSPSQAAAEQFGRSLAGMHRAGADSFGAQWPGFHGSARMDNTPSQEPWHAWYAARRLGPYLKMSRDRDALTDRDVAVVEQVINKIDDHGDEPPSRIHGDLWSGNLLWGADGRCWLVDPAAHGGHRETDLAYLRLWGGVTHLDTVVGAYREVWPLRDGWQERVALHQLSMYLLHTALFGAAFAPGVRETAEACPR
jgi:fructosamine-3-kinase